MLKKITIISLMVFISSVIIFCAGGCAPGEDDAVESMVADEDILLQDTGIFVGLIDNNSVEIRSESGEKVYQLGEGVSLDRIHDDAWVIFSYIENGDRPVLQFIEAVYPVQEGKGIFIGWIDSRSVEIKTGSEYRVFTISEKLSLEDVPDGSEIDFTYEEDEQGFRLLSVDVTEAEIPVFRGEGVFVGRVDNQSVEIMIGNEERVFALEEGLNIDHIADGSSIIFDYLDSGPRPTLVSVNSAESVLAGEGIFVGQIDSHSVEIEINGSYTSFALGAETGIQDIPDGSEVTFTYRQDEHRPVLLTIALR